MPCAAKQMALDQRARALPKNRGKSSMLNMSFSVQASDLMANRAIITHFCGTLHGRANSCWQRQPGEKMRSIGFCVTLLQNSCKSSLQWSGNCNWQPIALLPPWSEQWTPNSSDRERGLETIAWPWRLKNNKRDHKPPNLPIQLFVDHFSDGTGTSWKSCI